MLTVFVTLTHSKLYFYMSSHYFDLSREPPFLDRSRRFGSNNRTSHKNYLVRYTGILPD